MVCGGMACVGVNGSGVDPHRILEDINREVRRDLVESGPLKV